MTNVLYIHSHDTGKYISPYGYNLDSPNLEEFANDSVVFHKAFSVAPTCSPSRTSMLSSTYPHENGMFGLVNRGFKMNDIDRHIVRWFNKGKYKTVLCGIQHEAAHYDESDKAAEIIGYQLNLTTTTNLKDLTDKTIWDDENTQQFVSWLNKKTDNQPFFASMGFFATHRPYPKSYDKENHRVPDGFPIEPDILEDFNDFNESLKHMDKNFGAVIQALKNNNLYDDTMIIFTTDHGIAYPFGKSFLTDLGMEVSLMIKLKNQKHHQDIYSLVSHLDIVPTICDYIGLVPQHEMRGVSLKSTIEDGQDANKQVFFEMNFHTSFEPARAIRTNRYKYIIYLEEYNRYQLSNINDSKVKSFYIENGLDKKIKMKEYFYDLVYDPNEKNNLINSKEYASIINKFRDEMDCWRQETKDINLSDISWDDEWIVNKKETIFQYSKTKEDYIPGHEPKNLK